MTSRSRFLVAVILALAAAAIPALAAAHPLGNFSINHYAGLRITPGGVELDLVVDTAEIPAIEAIARLDSDRDGTADDTELDASRHAACEALGADISVALDGAAVTLHLVAAGRHAVPGASGLVTLRTVCEMRGEFVTPIEDGATLQFENRADANRIGWREIVVRGDGVTLGGDVASAIDRSQRLTAYPADLLQQPPNERSVRVAVTAGGPALPAWHAPDAWAIGQPSRPDQAIGALSVPGGAAAELPIPIDFRDLSPPVALLGILAAMVAGAGHALSPGHGKTVMAAYLIGSRGGARQAIVLGMAVTTSHTLGVVLLALIVLLAGSVVPPERLYPILTGVSGATVIVIGAVLLAGCIRRATAKGAGHDHDHGYAPDHGHDHGHAHGHDHEHPQRAPAWRGLVALGVAGGLVPSTAALVLLLGAIGAGQPAYGLGLAIAFGAGMAIVLSGIGLALVHGRSMVARRAPNLGGLRVARALPWVTAVLVLAGGIVLTGGTLATRL